MTDKEFRHLSRTDLIEIIFELQNREKDYLEKLADMESRLRDQEIKLNNERAISEAVSALNELLRNARFEADKHLSELMSIRDNARLDADRLIREASARADSILAQASEKSAK